MLKASSNFLYKGNPLKILKCKENFAKHASINLTLPCVFHCVTVALNGMCIFFKLTKN